MSIREESLQTLIYRAVEQARRDFAKKLRSCIELNEHVKFYTPEFVCTAIYLGRKEFCNMHMDRYAFQFISKSFEGVTLFNNIPVYELFETSHIKLVIEIKE